jgi:2-polyprenyl-6-methoxyphenol hydroxylase-like FAD-dependent oxidoreductase
MTELDADVAIVGYGPVGQTMAAMLAGRGHRVVVYERFAEMYRLPRAVYFDDEIMQVWQALGIVDELADDLLPVSTYDWFGADGKLILKMELPSPALSGWEPGYSFFQPTLEAVLDRVVRALPTAAVHLGWGAEALGVADDHVALTLRRLREPDRGQLEPTPETTTVRARYVIGADGANSFVRTASGIGFEDQGFSERWLVIDLLPDDVDALSRIPGPCQWCDPARPHMRTRNGRRHLRFEFMLLPGERPEEFNDEKRVWKLLEPWMTPADASIVRSAVYQFRARLAQTMRAGRALLVGDAAHTMPPFMGQGLCSGIRDAAALAWRLDLILRGRADDLLLHSYTAERRPQNEWIVNLSTEMGRVSCVLDARAAAERDAAFRAAEVPPATTLPGLAGGLRASHAPLAGVRAVQGTVRLDGRNGRFNDLAGGGFVLLTRQRPVLSDEHARFLEQVGAQLAVLGDLDDLDGRLTAWLDEHDVAAVLIRPDSYVFGAAATLDSLPSLVEDLRTQLHTIDTGGPTMPADALVAQPKFQRADQEVGA